MTKKSGPAHVVVDGSNIATEGRSLPTLEQLNDAVMGFIAEHPDTLITVVVDATFGHRIPKKEAKAFEAGIANNELVAPPAGAVGRGDAFVLGIADKANATVLSNDSFQEFHGEYTWLFDEGRLIGGKPVPHVGWVFVNRVPVRGPVSRKATQSSKPSRSSRGGSRTTSKAASLPMPIPKEPPPTTTSVEPVAEPSPATASKASSSDRASVPRAGEPVNDLMPFIDFVEHHPVGTSINATVDAYSSHGAYVSIGDHGVRAYVPLRLMSDPPPRSAKKVLKMGESTTLVVVSFAPERRSIDCALPDMADAEFSASGLQAANPAVKRRSTGDAVSAMNESVAPTKRRTPAKKAPAKKTAAKKSAAKKSAAKKSAAKKAPAKSPAATKTAAKRAKAKKAPAKKTAAKKTAAKTPAAKTPAAKRAPAKSAAATKTAAKRTKAKKAPAKKQAAKKRTTKKTVATKSSGGDGVS